MKEKKIVVLIFCLIVISSLACLKGTYAKYVFTTDDDVEVATKPFHFESNANNITIPSQNPNFSINVENYLGQEYTEDNITYTISISDGNGVSNNYNFSIGGVEIGDTDTTTRTLTGGVQTTDALSIGLVKKVANSNVEEDVVFTLKSTSPYSKTITFTVTVISPSGFQITGNPTQWTNQDVTLTVVPDDPSNVLAYSFDGGTTWQASPSKTYANNDNSILVRIKDNMGNETTDVPSPITMIDKVDPSINFQINPLIVTLDDSVTIPELLIPSDNESGVSSVGLKVYRYEVASGRRTSEITNTNFFTYPGLYAIDMEVSDNVGNTTTLNSQILVRWPTGGRYVVRKTELDGDGVKGVGMATNADVSGLFQDDASTGYLQYLAFGPKYYFAGPGVNNNQLTLGSYTYSILGVATNDDIKIIAPESSRNIRWSTRKIFSSTQYADWQTWWEGKYLYYNNDSNYRTFTDQELAHIDEGEFYAGRFTKAETPTLLDTIEYERLGARYLIDGSDTYPARFNGHFAFPTVSDYIKACNRQDKVYNIQSAQDNSTIFKSCSWLQTTNEQWTMNSKNDTTTDNDFWVLDPTIANNNRIVSRTYYYYENYRPVFYIKEGTILSGMGTASDPYLVQEDWSWFDNAQVLQ